MTMEEVKCVFCNKEHEPFWIESGYTGRKCFECGVIYVSPRPDENEMRDLYNTGRAGGESASEHIIYSLGKDLMSRHNLSIIKKFKTKGDLLEIGPGGGQFLLDAKSEGFNPFAVEINQELAAYIPEHLGIKLENVSASQDSYFESKEFDIIYHKNVLSHLHDPIGAFKILNNRLKKDGILVFETGNYGGIHRLWLRFLGSLGYPEHLYFHSIESVKRLLKLSGFKLATYYCYSNILHHLVSKILGIKRDKFGHTNTTVKNKASFFKKFKDYATFFLVYCLGRIFPKSWPATVVYIARKNDIYIER